MRVKVNGLWREAPDGISIAELLKEMSLDPRRVAVECNKRLVRRASHAEAALNDQDELEIVTLVGGG